MLEGLMKELEGIDLNDPEVTKLVEAIDSGEPEDGDEIIGVLDEQTIKLNILIAKMRRRAMQMMREHAVLHLDEQHDSESEACKSFHGMFGEHLAKIELLQEIAWKALRLDHGLINAESIGLCKGWKVVKCRPEPKSRDMNGVMVEVLTMSGPDDMADLLSRLGGQTPPRRRRGLFGH